MDPNQQYQPGQTPQPQPTPPSEGLPPIPDNTPAKPPVYDGSPHNPYEFILNDNKPKKSLLPGGNSKKQRIMIFAAGAGILVVVFILIFALLFSGGGSDNEALLAIAQEQTEVVRVASLGTKSARSNATLVFAENTRYSVDSAQRQTVALLAKRKKKTDSKILALKKDSAIDKKLSAAATAGTFDETFSPILKANLEKYQANLKTRYNAAPSKTEKDLLKSFYEQTGLLLKNLPASAGSSASTP